MRKITEKVEQFLELGGMKKDIVLLVISGISLLLSIFHVVPLPFDIAWVAIILCGVPIVLEAIIGLITAFDIKADVLVSIALIASVCIREDFAAGEIAFIMQLGALLEDLTVAKARAGIEKLVHLTPQTARIISNGTEQMIPAEKVQVGMTLRVLPGETIPVDGIITLGKTSINQAVMTGESLPVDKEVGDEISSGTVNQFGAFEMKATKVGEDSSIQRMIRLVQSADAGKAKIVGMADKWATWIVVIALSAAGLTWAITGEIIRAVTILVVFCPCALVLATPTAIMAAIGNCTKHGFLVRQGDALERLSTVSKIAFDKTGTLTKGEFEVVEISDDYLLEIGAYGEYMSNHPIARSIVKAYNKEIDSTRIEDFKEIAGKGLSVVIDQKQYELGNEKYFHELGIEVSQPQSVGTIVHIACQKQYLGHIVVADVIKESTMPGIQDLKKAHVLNTVMLTGDHATVAHDIASKIGIDQVYSDLLPQNKVTQLEKLMGNDHVVAFVGDGINDAPVLARSDIGIAMGGVGSDVAIEAADVVLMSDDITSIAKAIQVSHYTNFILKENVTFTLLIKIGVLVLTLFGLTNMWMGVFADVGVTLIAICNSMRILYKKS